MMRKGKERGLSGMKKKLGEFIKKRRLLLGLSLREFCYKYRFDPGLVSKIERGLVPFPMTSFERMANALHIEKGSPDWNEFKSLAEISRRQLPEILEDEDIMKMLPILARTESGRVLFKKELKSLFDKLKKEFEN